jgi:hypothetical protein
VAGGVAEFELWLWRERLAQEVEHGDRAHGVALSERFTFRQFVSCVF